MDDFFAPQDELRTEIAMTAARLIAEEGCDYPSARHQAIKTLFGKGKPPKHCMPSDQEIQEELRAYQALFQADTQPGELNELRLVALQFMQLMVQFEPVVYGAAVNGTGNAYSDIHVLAFSDDQKEVDYWLLNQNIAFDPCEDALLAGKAFPAVAFRWRQRWFQLGVASPVDRRGLLNRQGAGDHLFQTDLAGLNRLIEEAI
ncbi:UDP-N-acetylmuramate--alanine ligase [Limnobacter sp.]|uniref:UDP-N-acetylmuramate--alanine ligase n=1 Tax=Limnobacter sp. TaxID=2003368 RepID=UPI0035110654